MLKKNPLHKWNLHLSISLGIVRTAIWQDGLLSTWRRSGSGTEWRGLNQDVAVLQIALVELIRLSRRLGISIIRNYWKYWKTLYRYASKCVRCCPKGRGQDQRTALKPLPSLLQILVQVVGKGKEAVVLPIGSLIHRNCSSWPVSLKYEAEHTSCLSLR